MEINEQKKRIHPHKFTLWVAMGSIVMMFAGFTSAYIVKRNQANWQSFDMPVIFTYSTMVILASSIVIQVALKQFKSRRMANYRRMMFITAIMGAVFIGMQIVGFDLLQKGGIKLVGHGSNVAGSFLAVIAGMHILHVLGGVIAVLIILLKSYRSHTRSYNAVPIEVMATYWHFVDVLWIYLFIFLNAVN